MSTCSIVVISIPLLQTLIDQCIGRVPTMNFGKHLTEHPPRRVLRFQRRKFSWDLTAVRDLASATSVRACAPFLMSNCRFTRERVPWALTRIASQLLRLPLYLSKVNAR